MTDSATGYGRAPDRYSAKGRETIDRIRDALGDAGFLAFCEGQAIRYRDRIGLKDDAAQDTAKAEWYEKMVLRVQGRGPDPVRGGRASCRTSTRGRRRSSPPR